MDPGTFINSFSLAKAPLALPQARIPGFRSLQFDRSGRLQSRRQFLDFPSFVVIESPVQVKDNHEMVIPRARVLGKLGVYLYAVTGWWFQFVVFYFDGFIQLMGYRANYKLSIGAFIFHGQNCIGGSPAGDGVLSLCA
jgi:hypothetical protein